jgi:hypothetical protein
MESDRIMQLRVEIMKLEDEIESSSVIDFILMGKLSEAREELRTISSTAATGT